MNEMLYLDSNFSTQRLLTREKPTYVKSNSEDKFETVLFLSKDKNRKGEGGLRTKGYFKKTFNDKPLITIITVIFNGEKYLEETIQSVIYQTHDNVEYIIIDGGSTDRTIDIIKQYEEHIDYWVSEKDNGLYDAFNKGIKLATGIAVGILSSDDWYELNACELVSNIIKQQTNACIIHGGMKIYEDNKTLLYEKKANSNYKLLKKGMVINHPAMFVYLSVYKKMNFYLTNYKIAADWDFLLRCYINNMKFVSIEELLANFRLGGTSYTIDIFSIKEKHTIRLLNQSFKYFDIYYYYDILKILIFGNKLSYLSVLKQRLFNWVN